MISSGIWVLYFWSWDQLFCSESTTRIASGSPSHVIGSLVNSVCRFMWLSLPIWVIFSSVLLFRLSIYLLLLPSHSHCTWLYVSYWRSIPYLFSKSTSSLLWNLSPLKIKDEQYFLQCFISLGQHSNLLIW